MHGTRGGHSGRVRLAPRDEQHISRCHLDLLVWCHTRIDLCPISYVDGMRHLRVPDAPSLVSVNLHDKNVHEVPMWLERAALRESQIGIHLSEDSHFALDGRRKLTDLRNQAVYIVHNDADA